MPVTKDVQDPETGKWTREIVGYKPIYRAFALDDAADRRAAQRTLSYKWSTDNPEYFAKIPTDIFIKKADEFFNQKYGADDKVYLDQALAETKFREPTSAVKAKEPNPVKPIIPNGNEGDTGNISYPPVLSPLESQRLRQLRNEQSLRNIVPSIANTGISAINTVGAIPEKAISYVKEQNQLGKLYPQNTWTPEKDRELLDRSNKLDAIRRY
jgi:hypothetical protein